MKYEFISTTLDEIELKYKDKSFKFKRDLNIIKEMQLITKNARVKMIK